MSRCCLPRSSKRPHCCPRCSARNRPAAFSPPRPSLPLYCRSSSPRRSPSGCRCCSFPCSDSGKFRHCLLRLDSHSDQAKKNPPPVKHHPVPDFPPPAASHFLYPDAGCRLRNQCRFLQADPDSQVPACCRSNTHPLSSAPFADACPPEIHTIFRCGPAACIAPIFSLV